MSFTQRFPHSFILFSFDREVQLIEETRTRNLKGVKLLNICSRKHPNKWREYVESDRQTAIVRFRAGSQCLYELAFDKAKKKHLIFF